MRRRFYSFNNRFRTTKNTEAVVFEKGGFVGNLGLSKKLWKKYIEVCPNCIFNNYLCYGLLCNIVVLKVIKDEEMRHNK